MLSKPGVVSSSVNGPGKARGPVPGAQCPGPYPPGPIMGASTWASVPNRSPATQFVGAHLGRAQLSSATLCSPTCCTSRRVHVSSVSMLLPSKAASGCISRTLSGRSRVVPLSFPRCAAVSLGGLGARGRDPGPGNGMARGPGPSGARGRDMPEPGARGPGLGTFGSLPD